MMRNQPFLNRDIRSVVGESRATWCNFKIRVQNQNPECKINRFLSRKNYL